VTTTIDYNHPFNPNPHQNYQIHSVKDSKFVLDASKDQNNPNKLILWPAHGRPNQQWRFQPAGDGTFFIRNVESGGTLEIPDHSNAKPATQLHVSQPHGTVNEKWKIVPAQGQVAGKGFSIRSAYNDFSLDVRGGKMENGTQIIIYQNGNAPNQTWTISPC
jgi:hypothetical protein